MRRPFLNNNKKYDDYFDVVIVDLTTRAIFLLNMHDWIYFIFCRRRVRVFLSLALFFLLFISYCV